MRHLLSIMFPNKGGPGHLLWEALIWNRIDNVRAKMTKLPPPTPTNTTTRLRNSSNTGPELRIELLEHKCEPNKPCHRWDCRMEAV